MLMKMWRTSSWLLHEHVPPSSAKEKCSRKCNCLKEYDIQKVEI
jgi:hypothetical protein